MVVCRLLPLGNFLLLITTLQSLIPYPLPDGDSLSQPTHFRDVFFTAEAKIFLSPIALRLEMGGGSRFWVWFGIFFSAINNF